MARQWKYDLVVALALLLTVLFSDKLRIGASAEQSGNYIILPRNLTVIGEESMYSSIRSAAF